MGASEHRKSFPTPLIPCYRAGPGAHSTVCLTFRFGGFYQMDSSPAPNQKNKTGSIPELWGFPSVGYASRECTLLLVPLRLLDTGIVPAALVWGTGNTGLLLPPPKSTRIFASAAGCFRSGFKTPHHSVL